MRWYLAPRWLGVHALVLVALLACAGLGWWQLDRARSLHAASQRVVPAGAPVPLAQALGPDQQVSPAQVGRRVTVEGRYDVNAQLLVPNRPLDGRPGWFVAAPVVRADGPAVVVVRGWVPATADGTAPEVAAPPSGPVRVTGWLAGPDPLQEGAAPAPADGVVEALTPAVLVNALPYAVADGHVLRLASQPADAAGLTVVPAPATRTGGTWPVQNLFYAVEWWVFGGAAVWWWVVILRHEAADRRGDGAEAPATETLDVRPTGSRG